MCQNILTISNLHTHFELDEGSVAAVNGVSLDIPRGKTLCVVGESGSGKSVTAFSVLRLVQSPGRIVDGKIIFHDKDGDIDITALNPDGPVIRQIRGHRIAMIFQEPMTSFSPVYTIGSQIAEAVRLHLAKKGKAARQHTVDIMARVGIPDATRRFDQYPHQLSGGLRQRAMIAMALSCHPSLLIADEPTTALDVTIQAQILDLMQQMQREMNMSILLITHDLGVVAQVADEVAVMYLGRVVEQANVYDLFKSPQHPYTEALLQSVPRMQTDQGARHVQLKTIKGSVPDPFAKLTGCPFHPRCPQFEQGICDVGDLPSLIEVTPNHASACLIRQKEQQP